MRRTILLAAAVLVCGFAVSAQWVQQKVAGLEAKTSFRGLSVVNAKVIWASGTGGTVIRTINGGKRWDVIRVPGAQGLDFRDVEAFDAKTAYVLSIGNGGASRIYKTTDGGKTWELQFQNADEKAFYDAVACWNATHCVAMSDPVDGKFRLIATEDGKAWKPLPADGLPQAKPGEAAFAASGTCLIAVDKNLLYLVTGGSDARVFHSHNGGKSWGAADTPMVKGTSGSGIFSIAMSNAHNGIIVGGNYEKPMAAGDNVFATSDGGHSWKPLTGGLGYRSGVAFINAKTVIAVGALGSDISNDGGATWKEIGRESLNAVAARGRTSVWAVGAAAGVYKLK
ncbi:MAG: hypothetical protein IT172_08805 [Acidobacteria bacterium]|nr:hypothetical protein [Acidobacteriota bacterium]